MTESVGRGVPVIANRPKVPGIANSSGGTGYCKMSKVPGIANCWAAGYRFLQFSLYQTTLSYSYTFCNEPYISNNMCSTMSTSRISSIRRCTIRGQYCKKSCHVSVRLQVFRLYLGTSRTMSRLCIILSSPRKLLKRTALVSGLHLLDCPTFCNKPSTRIRLYVGTSTRKDLLIGGIVYKVTLGTSTVVLKLRLVATSTRVFRGKERKLQSYQRSGNGLSADNPG